MVLSGHPPHYETMNNYWISLQNYMVSLTYEEDDLFGHPLPSYEPIPFHDLLANNRGNRTYCFPVCYSKEKNIPNGYIIVSSDLFQPSSLDEEMLTMAVNKNQVAIPMKWLFKIKDMDIYEQWNFIRNSDVALPTSIKLTSSLKDAMNKVYDLGMENEFLNLFYDMKFNNRDEFDRQIDLYNSSIDSLKSQINECMSEINKLRQCWDEYYDILFQKYKNSNHFYTTSFLDFCADAFKIDRKSFPDYLKVDSVVIKISMLSKKLRNLSEKHSILKRDKLYYEMSHSINDY